MPDPVPTLVPRRPTRSLRLLRSVLPGVRSTTAQIEPYTAWWNESNRRWAARSGPLLVAIGDSTAIGIGASSPDRSYVALLHARLAQGTGEPWRVINLALSGARVRDALDRQLPALTRLEPDVVTVCVGTNDLVWGRETTALRRRLRRLVDALPPEAVIGTLAGASPRGQFANRALGDAAGERGLPLVNPWGEPGPPPQERLAVDRFHPNDLGYELMWRPFGRQLGLVTGAGRRTDAGEIPGGDPVEG